MVQCNVVSQIESDMYSLMAQSNSAKQQLEQFSEEQPEHQELLKEIVECSHKLNTLRPQLKLNQYEHHYKYKINTTLNSIIDTVCIDCGYKSLQIFT